MHLLHRLVLPSALVLTAACGGTEPAKSLVTVESQRALQNIDFAVGVTVDPVNGEQYILDNNLGLVRLGANDHEVIAAQGEIFARDDFTDVVALGNGRFAMTVINDGFLLDLNEQTFEQFFCYLPGELIEEFPEPMRVDQVTNSLAYDPVAGVMYAQPQTFVTQDGNTELMAAQVGEFDATNGGEGYGWVDLDKEFNAGGLAVDTGDTLLLGSGTELHRLRMSDGNLSKVADLKDFGIANIDGITKNADGSLAILDGRQLVTIRLNELNN